MKNTSKLQKLTIALTEYGWSLDTDSERLGLFVTQGQAIAAAKLSLKSMKSNGISASLVVNGTEVDTSRRRVMPFVRLR